MSAAPQFRLRESSGGTAVDRKNSAATHAPEREDPLQLLRDAIAKLKSSTSAVPDREQMANLLAEAREALERANVVANAVAQCDAHLADERFEQAFAALDESLAVYPDDARLVARRREVEERQKAFKSAIAVRGAIQEANWLLDHDRTDLAAQLLKQKASELPDQQELGARLAELESLLPEWEEKRHVKDALARAHTLEQLAQWQAALTVIEEALRAYPSSTELRKAAERIRGDLVGYARWKKLARRIELIRQQIRACSWGQALSLLASAQLEFPETNEWDSLRCEIEIGSRRSECEEVTAEIRECLAGGELEQAEHLLERGLGALGAEPALEALRYELAAEKQYRDELRQAQVLFGRRELEEAERVLIRGSYGDRREAEALLEAVRAARAASVEETIMEQGCEKALRLIQQQEFAQAADLLRNLLTLFPGDPTLERDLATAQAGLEKQSSMLREAQTGSVDGGPPAEVAPAEITPAVVAPPPHVETLAALPQVERASAVAHPSFRRAAIVGALSLTLAFAAAIAWKLSHRTPPETQEVGVNSLAASSATPMPSAAKPLNSPAAPLPQVPARRSVAASESGHQPRTSSKTANAEPRREFIPPSAPPSHTPNQTSGALPLPPGTNPNILVNAIPALPSSLSTTTVAPPRPQPVAAAAPPLTATVQTAPTGGKTEQPQLITRVLPTYPATARERALIGEVRLNADINERGDVTNVKVVAGNPVLAAAAKAAVARWKYKPATLNGKPIATSTEIRIEFTDRDR